MFLRLLLVLLLASSLMIGTAHSETLTIATMQLEPYGFEQGGVPTGLAYELANRVAVEAEFTAVNRLKPLKDLTTSMLDGTADMVITTEEATLDARCERISEALESELVIFGRAGAPYRTVRDLRGKTVAVLRNADHLPIDRKHGFATLPMKNYEQGLTRLLTKQVNAVAGTRFGLMYAMNKLKLPKRTFGPILSLGEARLALYVSKTSLDQAQRDRLKKAWDTVVEDGTLLSVITKYSF